MRFRGGGVGHCNTQDATNWFMADHHPLDLATNDNEDQIENEEEDTLAGNIEREGEEEQRPMDPS